LVLWKFAWPEAVGEIERAVLDREAPVQDVDIAGERRTELTVLSVDTEVSRRSAKRMLEGHRAGDGERSQPGQAIRKIPEALAEENSGLERVGTVFADAPRPRAADAPGQTGREHHLVLVVLVEQPLKSETCR